MTGLQGIYSIDTWTRNDTACDAEGASILETQGSTMLYIKVETFITEKFVNVVPCADMADCEQMAADPDTIHLGQWGFQDGSDGDGWQNIWYSVFTNFDDDTMCDGRRNEDLMVAPSETGIRLESRSSAEVTFTRPSGLSDCFDVEDSDAEGLVGMPACEELEVLSATFTADLP